MLKNHFQIALRSILKNKVFSLITLSGLSIGMAAFLFIIHYVRFEKSYEDFHLNSPDIYRITLDLYHGSEYIVTDCETHAPMGQILKDKMPEVKDFVRMFHMDGQQDVKVRTDKYLEEGLYYADESIFNVFTLTTLYGDPAKALTDPFTAVLTESTALKYFGKPDARGELFSIGADDYHVSAVIADLPSNTHIKFKILISHSTLLKRLEWYKEDSWNGNNEYTYLLMNPNTDLKNFNSKLMALSIGLKDKLGDSRYTAQPMRDIHLHSNKTYEPEANGNARVVYFLLMISIFVIVIAWVNYINLSTARAMERAREVGIRKVMGSLKSQLIRQFMSESVLLNIFAGAVALLMFVLLLPAFKNVSGQPLPSNVAADPIFWFQFAGIIGAGALLAGIYPAFVLSSFQPVAVLKGKFQSSSHGQLLRKSLVVFQFGATVVLLICVSTVYLQIDFMRHYDLGMNMDQTLVVRAPRMNQGDSIFRAYFNTLKNEVLKNPDVLNVARSGSVPGLSLHELSTTGVSRMGKEKKEDGYEFYYYGIDADFIETMSMQIIAGRNFEKGKPNFDQIIINEEGVRRLGFANPEAALGEKTSFQTRWPGEPARIIGVVKNFYQRSPKEAHLPMLFKYTDADDFFSIKLHTNDMKSAVATVQKSWTSVYPNTLFSYFFLDEKFGQQFQSDKQFGQVMAIFSGLAVFIACLGLFGLSSYTIIQRTKEIGVRKILGASVGQIVTLLSQDFLKVVTIAAIVALPVAYYTMEGWLSNYAIRIGLNVWLFVVPVIAIIAIALLTVSFQTVKTALANPVKSLRQE